MGSAMGWGKAVQDILQLLIPVCYVIVLMLAAALILGVWLAWYLNPRRTNGCPQCRALLAAAKGGVASACPACEKRFREKSTH
jgi:hypothetical protein